MRKYLRTSVAAGRHCLGAHGPSPLLTGIDHSPITNAILPPAPAAPRPFALCELARALALEVRLHAEVNLAVVPVVVYRREVGGAPDWRNAPYHLQRAVVVFGAVADRAHLEEVRPCREACTPDAP